MNHVYRLVWNHALRQPQVASELANGAHASVGAKAPRRSTALHPLTLALSLALVSSPAWSACTSTDTVACSAPGGAGVVNRTGSGGAGNGSGGGSSYFDFGSGATITTTGSPAANGNGGSGAAGDAGQGGAGGTVGVSIGGNIGVGASLAGNAGTTGADGNNFSSGGGGGGSPLFFTGTQATIAATVTGGAGGNGGNGLSGFAANGAGGGGGGAAMITVGSSASIDNQGQLIGGAGGNGGNGGFNGGGGAGGDGLLVLGTNTMVINTGAITGGAGGAAGAATNDGSARGGTGGAGVNLAGQRDVLFNAGTITGGAGAPNGNGGYGVVTWGGGIISNQGTISGGLNADGSRATAIEFNGTGNALTLLTGSTIVGDIGLAAGAQATIDAAVAGQVLGNHIDLGNGAAVTIDTNTKGLQYTGTLSGAGDLNVVGSSTLTLNGAATQSGALNITGATMLVNNGGYADNNTVADNGHLVVDAGSNINANGSGNAFLVGTDGNGVLTLQNGATAYSGGNLVVGDQAGDQGTANVTGPSFFRVMGNTVIGGSGNGSLALDTGGSLLSAGALTVGDQAGANGVVTLTGQATHISAGGFVVGNRGTGVLTVSNGSRIDDTGGFVIAANAGSVGTVNIGAAAGSAAADAGFLGASSIVFGNGTGTLVFNHTGTGYVFAPAISGAGKVEALAGTTIFTANHTYTGGTVIGAGGVLQLGQGGTSGTLQGDVANDGALVFDRSDNVAFAGAISGTGSVTQQGTGVTALSGAHSYTGATVINGGTLQLLGTGSIAASSGVTMAGGSFDISALSGTGTTIGDLAGNGSVALGSHALTLGTANDTTFGGAIADSGIAGGSGGALIKQGSGTLELSGANTYTGGTTLDGGMLRLTGAGSIAASKGLTINAGTFDIAGATSGASIASLDGHGAVDLGAQTLSLTGARGQYDGVIGGTGAVVLSGGTETLAGNNTYSGGTTVHGATLSVGSDANLGAAAGALALDGGTLRNTAGFATARAISLQGAGGTLRTDADLSLASAITGSGGLTKTGTGMLTLNGANTYIGGTTVSGGTLEVGDIDHGSASLAGNVTVSNAGTLRGHGTIAGDVVSDGIVWPGGSVGTLTINGNYTQHAGATLQIDVTPTQASALRVNGHASLAGGLSLIYAPGTYTATTYTLVQAQALTGTFANVTSSGSTPTALNPTVAYTATRANLVLAAATLPPVTPTVVAPVDGALYANLMRSASLAGMRSLATVLDATLRPHEDSCGDTAAKRKDELGSSCDSDLWMQYSGSSDSLRGANGLDSTAFALQGGFDHALGADVHLGVEAGVERINATDRLGGHGRADNLHGGLYAYANAGPLVLSGTVDVSRGSYDIYRQTGVGRAAASPDGSATGIALQAAWPFAAAQWQVTPALGALYQHQRLDGFGETVSSAQPLADAFAVRGQDSTYNTLQPYARVAFSRSFVAGGVRYVPQFDLGYRYDTRSANTPLVRATGQDGTQFALAGSAPGRGMATVGARITAQAGASWSLYLDYQGQFASHLRNQAVSAGFSKSF
ncbi:autotransporter-associated beta strand repeat-containing protein [Dyella sp. BiH032]|uniref:autotransporter-associated beta strand repeat-containing protein n=1 Tax=Dyella sp. BiH032 TaxID=3075430 RepID=UPI002892D260|nr:autotransporter-associated beta strand repeat-containing protein [Dyella sp. BiH032]WNL46440.1 autotransporter-associated beta strand repeat-containing protein [Dyella sp. BiH032]